MYVCDKMQCGYEYECIEPVGEHFADDFTPALSPKQMLELGVFEGHYLNDCAAEFPSDWYRNAKLSPARPNVELNFFRVKSRMSLSQWRIRGWIKDPDPRGWFQWYCRYYLGRRIKELDEWQIKRWRAFKRHQAQINHHCSPGDLSCRERQRQALLQWAYNPFE